MSRSLLMIASLAMIVSSPLFAAEDRDTKVRNDRKNLQADKSWVYNDLSQGFELAKKTGKPLLVVLRCIP